MSWVSEETVSRRKNPLPCAQASSGCEGIWLGNYIPHTLAMEIQVEKQLGVSNLTAAEDTQSQVYYLKAFKSEKIKTWMH